MLLFRGMAIVGGPVGQNVTWYGWTDLELQTVGSHPREIQSDRLEIWRCSIYSRARGWLVVVGYVGIVLDEQDTWN